VGGVRWWKYTSMSSQIMVVSQKVSFTTLLVSQVTHIFRSRFASMELNALGQLDRVEGFKNSIASPLLDEGSRLHRRRISPVK